MPDPALLVLIGTKAQFIKTAPILRALDARAVPYRLVYTGQHSETFDALERAFGTRAPDEVLVPRTEAATHGSVLAWTMRFWLAVARRLLQRRWHGLRIGIVHGDTLSTLFGALAIRMAGARVAHIEAGLRSPRLADPFPEEIVRRLVSMLSRWHFAPDAVAVSNLRKREGVVDTRGNTLRDALTMALARIGGQPEEIPRYAIVSIHRNENLSRRADFALLMQAIVDASRRVDLKFVLHPATRERIRASGWLHALHAEPGLTLVERMDYPAFVRLLVGSRFLMTDGGSNQEEAAMLGIPTLLLRRTTERADGLGDNVVMSGLDPGVIASFVACHADASWTPRAVHGASPSERIVATLAPLAHADRIGIS